MGGYGSGRYSLWHSKATTVDECTSIDANRWMREGILVNDTQRWGGWQWTYTSGHKNSISYRVNTQAAAGQLRLLYTTTVSGTKHEMDYQVQLQTTPCNYGGVRWWFTCPLSGCGRRVGKLYLPPGGRYFGCRRCYQLTYRSCQESDKRVSAILRNPDLLRRMTEDIESASPTDLLMVFKVMERLKLW